MGLSVIVPVFNLGPFLEAALNSVAAQAVDDLQIIVVDDCSTDGSLDVATRWVAKYQGDARILNHAMNQGLVGSANTGLRHATKEFVSILDGDDLLCPGILQLHQAMLIDSSPDVAAVYGNVRYLSEDGTKELEWYIDPSDDFGGDILLDLIEQGSFFTVIGTVVRRSVLDEAGGFDESFGYWDWFMWLTLASRYQFQFSREMAGFYRRRATSMSHTRGAETLSDRLEMLGRIVADDPTEAVREATIVRARELSHNMWEMMASREGSRECRKFLRRGFDVQIALTYAAMVLRLPRSPVMAAKWRLDPHNWRRRSPG